MNSKDEIIEVRLPRKEFEILQEMIETRQALSGLKKWFQSTVLFVAGSLLTILGVFEILKRSG